MPDFDFLPDRPELELNTHQARYRAAMSEHRILQPEWKALLADYAYRCIRCHQSGIKLEKDHVLPIGRGGRNLIANIQPLCRPCNKIKDDRHIDYRVIDEQRAAELFGHRGFE